MTAPSLTLVAPFAPSLFDSCLSDSFRAIVMDQSHPDGPELALFMPDVPCMETWTEPAFAPSASISLTLGGEQQTLVWVESKAVDQSLLATLDADIDIEAHLRREFAAIAEAPLDQDVLSSDAYAAPLDVIYRSRSAILVSVDDAAALTIDTLLPRYWKSSIIPKDPVPFIPVPSEALEHVKEVLANLKFDPVIASTVNSMSLPQMINDIRFLTGEDGKSGIVSRHSFSEGSRTAAEWLKERVEATGATCEFKQFLLGFADNVVCRYTSIVPSNNTVLISAHYDSRGSFGSLRAPGADDDGSGTTGLLAIARAIGRKNIRFLTNVELVFFAGEEQGLLGSRAYAKELRDLDANLTMVIQADMIAYHEPGEPLQLGLPESIGSPEVAGLVAEVASLYVPEMTVGTTRACCSDHQSFHQLGFPATQVFERAGPIIDPMYHNSGDLSDREGYDFDQLKAIAMVEFATLLHVAGYEI